MANEPKPQPSNPGTGGKVGDAGHKDGGSGERSGAGEENTADNPKRGADRNQLAAAGPADLIRAGSTARTAARSSSPARAPGPCR